MTLGEEMRKYGFTSLDEYLKMKDRESRGVKSVGDIQRQEQADFISRLEKLNTDYSDLYSSYNSRFFDKDGNFTGTYGKTDNDHAYSNYTQAQSRLGNEISEIQGLLNKYSNKYDSDTVDKINAMLKNASDGLSQMGQAYEFYSNFHTENDYNAYIMNNTADREDGMSAENVAARAKAYEANNARMKEIEDILDQVGSSEVVTNGGLKGWLMKFTADYDLKDDGVDEAALIDEYEYLQEQNRLYERYNKENDRLTEQFVNSADFIVNSAYIPQESKNTENGGFHPDDYRTFLEYYNVGTDINEHTKRVQNGEEVDDYWYAGQSLGWNFATEDEFRMLNYLANTQGDEAAQSYYDALSKELTRRRSVDKEEKWDKNYENAKWYEKVGLNVASVPEKLYGTIFNTIDGVGDLITGQGYDPYAAYRDITAHGDNTRKNTAFEIDEATGGGEFLGVSWGDAYQAAMSGIDSIVGLYAFGSKAYPVIMGIGAASSKAKQLYKQGASNGQIAAASLFSGAAEMIFEKFSIDSFLGKFINAPTQKWYQLISQTLLQGGIEASEEMATELSNVFTDVMVLGSRSDWEKLIAQYKEQGYSDSDAFISAAYDIGGNVIEAGIGGFISGGMMGGGGSAINLAQNNHAYNNAMTEVGGNVVSNENVKKLVDIAKTLDNTKTNAKIKALASEIEGVDVTTLSKSQQKAFSKKVGELYSAIEQTQSNAVNSSLSNSAKSIIREQLSKNGITDDAEIESAIKAIMKVAYDNGKLTAKESDLMEKVGGNEIVSYLLNNKSDVLEKGNINLTQRIGQQIETQSLTKNKNTDTRSINTDDYTFSDDGKTYIKGSDEAVDITGIASIKNGKMTVDLSNGKTTSLDNVELGSSDQAILYEGVLDMGIDAASAQAIVNSFDNTGNISATAYIYGMQDAVKYGKIGAKAFLDTGAFTSDLNVKQREMAYEIGRITAENETKRNAEKVNAAIKMNKDGNLTSGSVKFDGISEKELNARQKMTVNVMKGLFGNYGINIVFFRSGVDKNGNHIGENGSYDPDTNTIRLDVNAGMQGKDTILFTAAHELTHFIKQWSPEKFQVFGDFLLESYAKRGVDVDTLVKNQIDKAKRNGREMSYEAAYEEVVADSCETFLRDSKLLDRLIDLAKRDMTLFEKTKLYISELFDKVKTLRKQYKDFTPDSYEGQKVLEMTDAIEQLHNLWEEAALSALDNSRKAGGKTQKNTTEKVKDNVKKSDRDSLGNNLTATQQEYFADSKVRDDNGNLMVVYHGTRNADFTVFKKNVNYFTDSKEMADSYSPSGEMFEGYLNIKKPYILDAKSEKWSKIPIDEETKSFMHRYGASVFKEGGQWRTTPADIASAIEEAIDSGDMDYDGIIIKNIDDTGSYYKGKDKHLATDYIVFNSNQFKNIDNRNPTANKDIRYSLRDYSYKNRNASDYYSDSIIYTYDFLVSQKDMKTVSLPATGTLSNVKGKIDDAKVLSEGKKNILSVGIERNGKIYVKNLYTNRELRIDNSTIKHGLSGTYKRHLTNARIASVIGSIVQNAIPINALKNTSAKAEGTYAMVSYCRDNQNREFIAVVTVEQHTNNIDSFELYDVAHAVSGRQKNGSQVDTKSQGVYPIKATTVSIADLLMIVNDTHQSILSDDVLSRLGQTRNPDGAYSDKVLFSYRDPEAVKQYESINKHLVKENMRLREDVNDLKELVKLQRKLTHGKMFTKSSLDVVSRRLMNYAGAKGNTAELAAMLNDVYTYIANGEDVSWDGIKEKATSATNWLQSHENVKRQRDEYADEVLKTIRESRIMLSEKQKSEAAYLYGSFGEYRKRNMGKVNITNDGISLDTQWQEWAEMYPAYFDKNINEGDQVSELVSVIDSLQNSYADGEGYAFQSEMVTQDLVTQIYDEYWNLSTLHTAADAKQKEITLLKSKHAEQIKSLREFHNNKHAKLKKEQTERIANLREKYRAERDEKVRKVAEYYQESRKKSVESRHKTEMKRKIKSVVNELNHLFAHGTKERNIKIDLEETVASALKTAELLFNSNITNADIIRNGNIIGDTTAKENQYISEYAEKLTQRDEYISKIEALGDVKGAENTIFELQDMVDRIDRKTAKLDKELSDVFERTRSGLNKAKVSTAIGALADAYKSIQNSKVDYIKNAYDEYIQKRIEALKDSVGGTLIRDMSLVQMREVYDAFKMVLTTVRKANTLFKEGKTEYVDVMSGAVMDEIKALKKGDKDTTLVLIDKLKNLTWEELKPIYAFNRLGSKTLLDLYNDLRKGEDIFGNDIAEAKLFIAEKREQYGYDKWSRTATKDFKISDGRTFSLTIPQMMSIYAYSKREQAYDHIEQGGFVFDTSEYFVKNNKGIMQYKKNAAEPYKLKVEDVTEIINALTDNQRKYVEDMQKYLSEVMGTKGNEVARELYGIDLFTEAFYFPLCSAEDYITVSNTTPNSISLRNSGMTKETVPHADNPIVLSGFDSVWASHVNKMSLYHSFVLGLENFRRVYNYHSNEGNSGYNSVTAAIRSVFGDGANSYISKFIDDVNGGMPSNEMDNLFMKGFTTFKKTAVAASLSTAIQQPTAIIRAMAYIDFKYFIGQKVSKLNHAETWEELKKYAPIAVLKEIGGFDAGSGKNVSEYLVGNTQGALKKAQMEIDDKSMWLAQKGDEIGWNIIWNAVKRETKANNPGLDINSEEFLTRCGDRFTEIVTKTQVYDSVFSRSGFMRSNNDINKMATSFMGEPTTSFNMMFDAVLQVMRGNVSKKQAGRIVGSVIASQVLANAFAALIYALRDDDDDESYFEKYTQVFLDDPVKSIALFVPEMLPYVKDLISIFEGYGVERPDMTIVQDIKDAIDSLDSDKKSPYRKTEELLGAAANLFGIPLKNVMRTGRELYNLGVNIFDDNVTEFDEIGETIVDGMFGETTSSDINDALERGKTDKAKQYIDEIVNDASKNATNKADAQKKAKSNIRSAITTYWKKQYVDAVKVKDYTEMNRIRKLLYSTGLYGTLSELDKDLEKWRTAE